MRAYTRIAILNGMAAEPSGLADLPCVCSQLRRTSRLVSVLYDSTLEPAGVTVTQYAVLARIGRVDGFSRTALAAQLGMDRTTLTRNLLPLERAGLVTSKPGEDRREKLLHLTPAGKKKVTAARPYWVSAQRKILNHMGLERLRELRKLLAQTEGVRALGIVRPK